MHNDWHIDCPAVTLAHDERGVLLAWPMHDGGAFDGGTPVDFIRHQVILFDKFVRLAPPPIMYVDPGEETKSLIASGLATEAPIVSESFKAHLLIHYHLALFDELKQQSPHQWAIGIAEGHSSVLEDGSGVDAFRLKLHQALTMPDREVALEDVLAFRQRRLAEVKALHHYLDSLCLEAASHPDKPLAEHVAFNKLDNALSDWNKAMREPNWKKVLAHLDVKFNLMPGIAAAVPLAMMEASLPKVIAAAAVAIAAQGTLEVVKGKSVSPGGRPLEYLTSVSQHLY